MSEIIMETITKDQLKAMVENSNGRFFSAKFIKENNEVRKIVGRSGVTYCVKGTGSPCKKDNIKRIYDVQKHAYRSLNYNTTFEFKIAGKVYKVEG